MAEEITFEQKRQAHAENYAGIDDELAKYINTADNDDTLCRDIRSLLWLQTRALDSAGLALLKAAVDKLKRRMGKDDN